MKKENYYGELNELNLKMLIALSRTTQAVHKRSSFIFKQGGLTTAQFSVLEALYHKGPMSINQIIHTVLSTPGNMTVVINNLERDGMVSRCDPSRRQPVRARDDHGKGPVPDRGNLPSAFEGS